MEKIGEHFVRRARERNVEEAVAREIFSYIQAYAGYGFCEAHASAFGDTAYKTAYIKSHYPAEFYAALLSNQPMGFYPPNTLVWEAKRRGIRVLGPDVNVSETRFAIEDGAIRVSLSQIRGMGESALPKILEEREQNDPFSSVHDFCRRVSVGRDVVRDMILCGAFDSLCPNRRQLLWELDAVWQADSGELRLEFSAGTCDGDVPDFTPRERWSHEFDILGIALTKHPMQWLRDDLRRRGVITASQVRCARKGQRVKVAGLVIRPHRPPTRSGRTVVFFTLEDETGMMDITVFESVYQRHGKPIFTQPVVTVTGRAERRNAENWSDSVTAIAIE